MDFRFRFHYRNRDSVPEGMGKNKVFKWHIMESYADVTEKLNRNAMIISTRRSRGTRKKVFKVKQISSHSYVAGMDVAGYFLPCLLLRMTCFITMETRVALLMAQSWSRASFHPYDMAS